MTWGGMGGNGSRPSGGNGEDRSSGGRGGSGPPRGGNAGWTIFSYLIAGMFVYGGIGWLVARWTGVPLIFPLGMLIGLALGVVLIVYRYGRP
jgi:F0F1-type ATP synthase assembly protein I